MPQQCTCKPRLAHTDLCSRPLMTTDQPMPGHSLFPLEWALSKATAFKINDSELSKTGSNIECKGVCFLTAGQVLSDPVVLHARKARLRNHSCCTVCATGSSIHHNLLVVLVFQALLPPPIQPFASNHHRFNNGLQTVRFVSARHTPPSVAAAQIHVCVAISAGSDLWPQSPITASPPRLHRVRHHPRELRLTAPDREAAGLSRGVGGSVAQLGPPG